MDPERHQPDARQPDIVEVRTVTAPGAAEILTRWTEHLEQLGRTVRADHEMSADRRSPVSWHPSPNTKPR